MSSERINALPTGSWARMAAQALSQAPSVRNGSSFHQSGKSPSA